MYCYCLCFHVYGYMSNITENMIIVVLLKDPYIMYGFATSHLSYRDHQPPGVLMLLRIRLL